MNDLVTQEKTSEYQVYVTLVDPSSGARSRRLVGEFPIVQAALHLGHTVQREWRVDADDVEECLVLHRRSQQPLWHAQRD